MDIDRAVDALAALAGAAGLLLALLMWRRATRTRSRRQTRHPAAALPIDLAIAERADGPRWRISVDERRPSISVDIVTFRRSGSGDDWTSEPIVEPVEVTTGGAVVFDTVLPRSDGPYDVVVGWTTHYPTGDVAGSTTLTVPDTTQHGRSAADALRPFRWVYPVTAAVLALSGLVALMNVVADEPADAGSDGAPTEEAAVVPVSSNAPPSTATDMSATTSTSPPATTAPSDTAPGTSSPTTDAPTTSTPPSSTSPAETSTTLDNGPRVEIDGRVDDCRFGSDCVIAGFRVVGFAGSGEYVCEFDDGSRFVFRYVGDGADDACARSGPAPTITIEVDGIRSATISRESLAAG